MLVCCGCTSGDPIQRAAPRQKCLPQGRSPKTACLQGTFADGCPIGQPTSRRSIRSRLARTPREPRQARSPCGDLPRAQSAPPHRAPRIDDPQATVNRASTHADSWIRLLTRCHRSHRRPGQGTDSADGARSAQATVSAQAKEQALAGASAPEVEPLRGRPSGRATERRPSPLDSAAWGRGHLERVGRFSRTPRAPRSPRRWPPQRGLPRRSPSLARTRRRTRPAPV